MNKPVEPNSFRAGPDERACSAFSAAVSSPKR